MKQFFCFDTFVSSPPAAAQRARAVWGCAALTSALTSKTDVAFTGGAVPYAQRVFGPAWQSIA